MSRNVIIILMTISCLSISNLAFSGEPNYSPDRILVQFAPDSVGEFLGSVEKEELVESVCGGIIEHEYEIVPGLTLVKLPKGQTVEDSLESLNTADRILYAEPDYKIKLLAYPNDTYFSYLWGLNNTGQTGGTPDADIDASEAWDLRTDANNIIVAVIDTGVYYTHTDLAANMWHNPGEITGNRADLLKKIVTKCLECGLLYIDRPNLMQKT
jgi:subtilisin family serine protease